MAGQRLARPAPGTRERVEKKSGGVRSNLGLNSLPRPILLVTWLKVDLIQLALTPFM